MTPAEILSSESQERMCAVVAPENVDAFMAVCRKWEVLATVIGEVTDGDRLQITWHGETVVDVPPRTVAHEGPVYERPVAASRHPGCAERRHVGRGCRGRDRRRAARDFACAAGQSAPVQPRVHHRAVRPLRPRQHRAGRARRRRCAAHRRVHRARHRRVHRRVRPLHPTGPLRRCPARAGRGLPQRRGHRRHPGRGHQLPELRLAGGPRRDVAVLAGGAGLADGCAALGIPVTGGNVSFYNQTGSTAILPTPVVGVLGVIDDVGRRIPTGLGTEPGETLMLLGDTRDEFDGSIWAQVTADHLGGRPPRSTCERERLLAEVLTAASRDGLVSAAHDLSEGGLIQAVVEAALAGETGCRIVLPEDRRPVRDVVLRIGGTGAGGRAAHRGEPVPVDVRGARTAGRPASASSTRAATPSRCRASSRCRWTNCAARPRACCPGCSGDCSDP